MIKQVLNAAIVSYEELWRSRRVLSASANTLLDAVMIESFPFMMNTTFSEDSETTAPC